MRKVKQMLYVSEREKDNTNSKQTYIDDTDRDNWIILGIHRETWRYDRLAEVYRTILNDAHKIDLYEQMRSNILSLHDRKGTLTVTWVN